MSFEQEVKQNLEQCNISIIPCRNCGREIIFLKTKAGKLMPLTLELKSHFIDCPAANKFRK
jgi:hypothetical protein